LAAKNPKLQLSQNMKILPLNQIDYYKADHRSQYPVGTELIYSNLTPRSLNHLPCVAGLDDKIVFVGAQYFIKWFLMEVFNENFFKKDKAKAIGEYKRRMDTSLGKDVIKTDHVEALHDLGYLPISIRALPEGSLVNPRIPVLTIENTKPEFFWLTNYLETVMSNMLWKIATSATQAYRYKQILTAFAAKTGAPKDFVNFQAHDFSARGMSGPQDSVMSGFGHLASFVGTDTVAAIDFAEDYYKADAEKELIGTSVWASEHSVMVSEGEEGEFNLFKRLITEVYPKGIVSLVSDGFDYWRVITEYLPTLKQEILSRSGGFPVDKVVIRPDSGDPVKIICGYFPEEIIEENGKYYEDASNGQKNKKGRELMECEVKGSIECMWDIFGGTKTDKGYKVLDSHIGLIYGDSITLHRCEKIMKGLERKGFASCNVVLGVGSYTYQYVTRDSLGFAMKATLAVVNGQQRELFKDPKTDTGMKKSAKGYLAVFKGDKSEYVLADQVSRQVMENSELKEVFRDGNLLIEHSLAEIRARIDASVADSVG